MSRSGSIDALLHDATAVLVAGNFDVLLAHRIINEIVLRAIPTLKNFLNHVVAVDVFTHLFQKIFQVTLDHGKVLWQADDFDEFLNGSGPVRVLADLKRVFLY